MFCMWSFDANGIQENHGAHHMAPLLTFTTAIMLLVAGIAQALNGDKLGFTSYILHAAILGGIGESFRLITVQATGYEQTTVLNTATVTYTPVNGNGLYIVAVFCLFVAYADAIFTFMAFQIAKMFGILYFTVSLMFFIVAFNRMNAFGENGRDVQGISCGIVSIQCAYLMIPVLTGKGLIV